MTHPVQPDEEPIPPDNPEVIGLDDDRTGQALDALSSETARGILDELYDEPRTPKELQSSIGTSLQNVHYHLGNLDDAGLIQQSGTRFSEKGNEMTVYGPASQAVVVMAGDTDDQSLLKRALARLVGALGLLAAGSYIVGELFGREESPTAETTDGPSIAVDGAEEATREIASGPDPAVVFFVGGLFVLAVISCWWAYRHYYS
jgi:DNA-binding transcriptional ArsR family regulator